MSKTEARLSPISIEKADGELKTLYSEIKKNIGALPNIYQYMGNSPVILQGFLSMGEVAGKTSLSPQLREQIALTVAQANDCTYCLSAHTLLGGKVGLQGEQIMQARKGDSKDSKTKAILRFVKKMVDSKAKASDEDVSLLKAEGVSDQEVVEIIFIVNLNLFTNYFNHIVNTPIDFPKAPELK